MKLKIILLLSFLILNSLGRVSTDDDDDDDVSINIFKPVVPYSLDALI